MIFGLPKDLGFQAPKPKWYDGLIYSNVFIALSAVTLFASTFALWNLKIESTSTLLVVFSGTFILYNLSRLVSLKNLGKVFQTPRLQWMLSRIPKIISWNAISGLVFLVSFFTMPSEYRRGFLLVGLVALLYAIPVFGFKRLRDIPYIKIFLIAGVWAYLTLAWPLMAEGVEWRLWIFPFVERFLFILAITIPFDVRDSEMDQAYGLKTLASLFGSVRALRVAGIILISLALLNLGALAFPQWFAQNLLEFSNPILFGEEKFLFSAAVYTIGAFVVFYSLNQKQDVYFFGFIDGLMFLLGLGLFLLQGQ